MFVLILSAFLLAATATAQDCPNSVMINGQRLTGAACYFPDGNSSTFVRLAQVAELLELETTFSESHLTLQRGETVVIVASTRDLRDGLVRRSGVLQAGGEDIESPKALRVGEEVYLAFTPLVRALGGASSWDSSSNTVLAVLPRVSSLPATAANPLAPPPATATNPLTATPLSLPSPVMVTATSAETSSEPSAAATNDTATNDTTPTPDAATLLGDVAAALVSPPAASSPAASPAALPATGASVNRREVTPEASVFAAAVAASPAHSGSRIASGARATLAPPRLGVHADYARVVLDFPVGMTVNYQTDTNGSQLRVTLPGVSAESFTSSLDNPYLRGMRYEVAGDMLILVLEATAPLSDSDVRLERLPVSADSPHERLLIDVRSSRPAQATPPLATPVTPDIAQPQVRRLDAPRRTVVLDPGHGGRFAGAQGYVREEVVVLDISLKVKRLLEAEGIHVIMTRTSNTHLSTVYAQDLRARANLATNEHNFFVSIHANSAPNAAARGIETWIFGQPLDAATLQAAIRENGGGAIGRAATDEAIGYAGALLNDFVAMEQLAYSRGLAESVQSQLVARTNASNRGVKQSAFLVLRQSRIPAILIEVGFVTHSEEGRLLGTDSYQTKLAEGIAQGIIRYFQGGGLRVQQ